MADGFGDARTISVVSNRKSRKDALGIEGKKKTCHKWDNSKKWAGGFLLNNSNDDEKNSGDSKSINGATRESEKKRSDSKERKGEFGLGKIMQELVEGIKRRSE